MSKVAERLRLRSRRSKTRLMASGVSSAFFAPELLRDGVVRLALAEHHDRPGPPADQQIAFPMAAFLPLVHGLGALVDGAPLGDRDLGRPGRAEAALGLPARQEAPELLPAPGAAVDPSVDGLVADRPQPLGAALQPAGDLLGRPVLGQALDHEAPQIDQAVQQALLRPAGQIASLGRRRPVAPIRIGVAPQLASDRRFRPFQGPGDGAKRLPGFAKPGNRMSFIQAQMTVS